ncbi:hypothetical protein [Candidatus Amarolinea dominans]|uniref:hypothetical protein n=1 Tax=Candidatus Amarolinea dominans TaxID=3140696 RepID=UPI0031354DF7|nr:hypothetical protein [Anaerolineae bacterium]
MQRSFRFAVISIVLLVLGLLIGPAGAQEAPSIPQAGPCAPGAVYDPACDVDHDGDVDIFDVQLAAGHWNQTGVWTGGDYWALAGNAGTTPGSHFLGTTDNQPLEVRVNGSRALLIQSNGSNYGPNLIGGYSGNSVSAGLVGATIGGGGASGYENSVTGNYGTVGGGWDNTAGLEGATVGGGQANTAGGVYATLSGGFGNIASDGYGTVGGGTFNTASGGNATVGGGYQNAASGGYSTVGGGYGNTASERMPPYQAAPSTPRQASTVSQPASEPRPPTTGRSSGPTARPATGVPRVLTPSGCAQNGAYIQANNTNYAGIIDNDGNGDGLRAYAATSQGNNFGAAYVTNSGTSPGLVAHSGGTYAGYFNDQIYVTGGCTGCTLMYVAQNTGDAALEAGDLVAAAGVDSALTGGVDPVLRVQQSGAAAPGVVGVVFSRASVTPSEKEGEALDSVQAADGAAQPGDYLLIVVQGLARVKVAQGEALTPGQRLKVSDAAGEARGLRTVEVDGVTLDEGGPTVGVALDAAEDEMVWVMVALQ